MSYIVDSVLAFAYAAKELYNNSNNLNITQESLNCENASTHYWQHGDIMLKYVQQVIDVFSFIH